MKVGKIISNIVLLLFLSLPVHASKPDVLVVAASKDFLPFSYMDDSGEPKGVLIDLWREFGMRNQCQIQFKLSDWASSLEMIRTGDVDIHSGLFKSEDRALYLTFSQPLHIPLSTRLFVSSSLNIAQIYEAGDHPIGVIQDGAGAMYVRDNYPSAQIRYYPTSKDVVKAAIRGEVDLFVIDYTSAMYYLHAYDSPEHFKVVNTLYQKHVCAAVAKGDSELLAFVEQGMKNIPTDEFNRIVQKWMHSEFRLPAWFVSAFVGASCGLGFLFCSIYIVMLKRNKRALEKMVNMRTQELVGINKELRNALEEVKNLGGILPICSSCKKIRDSQGYWNQVDLYIQNHSDASCSHCLCEECHAEMYGDEEWFQEFRHEKSSDDSTGPVNT